jgi:hypothetical protein
MHTETITINYCTKAEMHELVDRYNVGPTWYRRYIRGFCFIDLKEIYIVAGCLGWLSLVAHELGHITGLKHCYFPSIMNFSGLFRWFCVHPVDVIRSVVKWVRDRLRKKNIVI